MSGWLSQFEQIPSPNHDSRGGFGIEAHVIHIMDGGFRGSIDWMRKMGTSSTFAVARTGYTAQLVSLDRAARANGISYYGDGIWLDPQGNRIRPPWVGLKPPHNPNKYTSSTENEGKPAQEWTPEMYDANVAILRAIGTRHNLAWVPGVTLIGHRDIGPVHRRNCPGPHVDFAYLARRGNERPAAKGIYRINIESEEAALVRQGPGTEFPIADRLKRGDVIDVDMGVLGAMALGSRLWLHLRDGRGFVHNALTEAA